MGRVFGAATVLCLVAGAARAQNTLSPVRVESDSVVVEVIGLSRWSLRMVEDSLLRYSPNDGLLSHACAAVLRERLHFADAAAQEYAPGPDSHEKAYWAVSVVEPQDSNLVRYRTTPTASQPDVAEWQVVRHLESERNRNFQYLLSHPTREITDQLEQERSGIREDASQLRNFLASHHRRSDLQRALRVLTHDGNENNRIGALVVLSGFAESDAAWRGIVGALRDRATPVNVGAILVLQGFVRERPRRVEWAEASNDLRVLLNGTNLFAHNLVMEALVATSVEPRLAPALLADGGRMVLGKRSALGVRERLAAQRLLVQLAGADLGSDDAMWRSWVGSLR